MSGLNLIEGLPDAVSLRCLAYVPYYLYPKLELVSHSWKSAIRSAELFKARQEVGSSEELLSVSSYEPNNTWQLYDPLRDLWITLPLLPSKPRHYFGAVSASQKLFVLGGRSGAVDPSTGDYEDNFSTSEVWSFDPVAREWSMRAPMLVPRSMFACCVIDGKIIVAGGFTSVSKTNSMAEMYDTEKDVWVLLPDLPQTHDSPCTGVVVGGRMHVLHKGLPSTVQILDSSELKWRVESCSWVPRASAMAVVGDSLYMLSQGVVLKHDGHEREVFVSASQIRRRFGMAMIGFRDELYVIGGVLPPEVFDGDVVKLCDVHVLRLKGEKPTWFSVAPMSKCRGTVFGCTVLKF